MVGGTGDSLRTGEHPSRQTALGALTTLHHQCRESAEVPLPFQREDNQALCSLMPLLVCLPVPIDIIFIEIFIGIFIHTLKQKRRGDSA